MSRSNFQSHDLFDLIRTMTGSEKRYVRLHAARNGGNLKYLNLFDALERQTEFSEEELRRAVPSINPEQLPNLKGRLHRHLLKSLRAYHLENDIHLRIGEMKGQIELLFRRGLFEQCRRLTIKTKNAAYANELYSAIPMLLEWERKLSYARPKEAQGLKRDLDALYAEQMKISGILNHLTELENLEHRLYSFFAAEGRVVRNREQLEAFRPEVDRAVASEADSATFRERSLIYRLERMFAMMCADNERSRRACRRWLALFDEHPAMKQVHFDLYMKALNEKTITLNMVEAYDDALALTDKVEALPETLGFPLSTAQRARIFDCHAFHRLETYLWTERFPEAVALIPSLEKGLEEFRPWMNPVNLHSKYYRIALAYLGNGHYEKSLEWVNTILNDRGQFRRDIRSSVRIVNLILHYELGHDDLLEYVLRSTYRYLYKIERLFETETILLDFLRRLPGISDGGALRDAFNDLLTRIECAFEREPLERYALAYFDIRRWLKNKIALMEPGAAA